MRFLAAPLVALTVAGCAATAAPIASPTDVARDVATLAEGRVDTTCFSFATDPSADYVLSPYAEACIADVGWEGGDGLTRILVRAQTGDASLEYTVDAAEQAGFAVQDASYARVDGRESVRLEVEDTIGFPVTIVVVPLPAGRFEHDGEPLTSVWVSAFTGSPDLLALFDTVVGSIDIHD